MKEQFERHCNGRVTEIYERCLQNAPNYGVTADCFADSLRASIDRYVSASEDELAVSDLDAFLDQIQHDDLFLSIACANGNERAWWEFDQQHRSYMERVARHLARTDIDATDVVDSVYEQLYGTRIVDGARVSKFSTYSGRGSLRGWLRTVIWHSLVDRHRAGHDEVSLDEMTENVGEGTAHANFATAPSGGEDEMLAQITRERYKKATVAAMEHAFTSLEPHEKLILLYYHVENMKLREIAKLVENEDSPLRAWFQRRSQSRESNQGRIHESTVMRWLEKCYSRILQMFNANLRDSAGLSDEEIRICSELATKDISGNSFFGKLSASSTAGDISGKTS